MTYSDGYRMSLKVPNSVDYERIKKNAFHADRILVVSIDDDRIAWPEREILLQVGRKLYGGGGTDGESK